jgi:hypothetical protein
MKGKSLVELSNDNPADLRLYKDARLRTLPRWLSGTQKLTGFFCFWMRCHLTRVYFAIKYHLYDRVRRP